VLVAEHLDLDVARAFDELLDEHAVVAEAEREALALGRLEAFAHVRSDQASRMPLPPPPAEAFIITG
jgi:hypothetical protein